MSLICGRDESAKILKWVLKEHSHDAYMRWGLVSFEHKDVYWQAFWVL
ncbi:hypothetical protein SLEP1_g36408 [Rubroshorea leprosula]|uniref:Uncharacterized protein n=1 Tax=Rubroshorea leprosula TaxID=152421 RepID=A0AAV5KRE7_9ROSI|nr:hypothetical protein SLEP1_g36408 [Rubroshorea leprosula]